MSLLLAMAAVAKSRDAEDTLSRQALEMARRLGEPQTLRFALADWHGLNLDPHVLSERLSVADELVAAAVAVDDEEALVLARQMRATDLLEAGEIPAAAEALNTAAVEARQVRLPALLAAVTAGQAAVALLGGRYDESEALARQAHAAAERSRLANVEEHLLTLLWAVRKEQGRFDEMAHVARRAIERPGGAALVARAQLGLALALLDQADEARRHLDAIVTEVPLARGWVRVAALAMIAETSWLVDEPHWAESPYEMLRQSASGHVLVGVWPCSLGATRRYLGQLSALLRRYDEADEHFEAAHGFHRRFGSPGWLAHGQVDHARMLLRRSRPADAERAARLISEARESYQQLGLTGLAERAVALLGQESEVPERGIFRLEGEYWSIEFSGSTRGSVTARVFGIWRGFFLAPGWSYTH